LAINSASSISKGDRIVVNGKLKVRDWDNGERTGTSVEIEADSIGHDMSYGLSEFTRTSFTPSEPKKADKSMTKNTIKIEGQDNNVSSVIDALTGNKSVFMDTHSQTYIGAEVYGLTDNPRWFGAEINTEGEKLDNVMLDSFRKEFPNVNAEVAE
jgi:single-strand DNA-binding protein